MKVTAKMLRAGDACEDQVEVFEKEWPNGTRTTKKACLRAVELELDIDWFASKFLSKEALEAYKKAIASAWEAYDKTRTSAWEAYKKAIASAWEAYDKTRTSAWEAYKKARTVALYEASRGHK